MKDFFRRGLGRAGHAIIVMSIVMWFGLAGDMNMKGYITLEHYRVIMMYSVLVGFFIGATTILFDLDSMTQKQAYIIHFSLGYIALNVFEGIIISRTLLPTSPPINYLLKLVIYSLAYIVITLIIHYKEKRQVLKINQKIEQIKNS